MNFLSLPGHRNQTTATCFPFPQAGAELFLPFFDGFLVKSSVIIILSLQGRDKTMCSTQTIIKAEERFEEIPRCWEVCRYCAEGAFVRAGEDVNLCKNPHRIRWQVMLEKPLSSFWEDELSKVWGGDRDGQAHKGQVEIKSTAHGTTKGWLAG